MFIKKVCVIFTFSIFIISMAGCSTNSPLAYKYTGPQNSYAVIESTFERIIMRNWTKFNLYAVDGKFPETDNFYGNTVPTKVTVGDHTIQINVITMIAEGLNSEVVTAKINVKYNFLPLKYKINGSTSDRKVWIETEDGVIVTQKLDIDYLQVPTQ